MSLVLLESTVNAIILEIRLLRPASMFTLHQGLLTKKANTHFAIGPIGRSLLQIKVNNVTG